MYVRWRKERQDSKGVIIVVLLQWGPTPHRKQHTCWSILQCTCTGEGKTRLKGSNPSYPASTHYGVESDVPF